MQPTWDVSGSLVYMLRIWRCCAGNPETLSTWASRELPSSGAERPDCPVASGAQERGWFHASLAFRCTVSKSWSLQLSSHSGCADISHPADLRPHMLDAQGREL